MELKKRLIVAEDLLEKFSVTYYPDEVRRLISFGNDCHLLAMSFEKIVKETIDSIPTVDAVEIKYGQWINNKDDYPECDNCGYRPVYDHMIDDIFYSSYCPNCGSKMMNGVRYETN